MTFKHGQQAFAKVTSPGASDEPVTIRRARAGFNFGVNDRKVGDGFQIGRYQAPGEYLDGVWHIVRFADGGELAIHETSLYAA
jgi:hypothetical protein